MGNIHGGCINVRRADSATARPTSPSRAPDFLTANDAWFMPVVAEDRAGRLPVHPRLVRPLPLLPGRQPRPGGHRPPARPALSHPLQGHAAGRRSSTWRKESDDAADRAAAQPERLLPRHGPAAADASATRRRVARQAGEAGPRRAGAAQGADARPVGAGRQRRRWTPTSIEQLLGHKDPGYPRLGACGRRATPARWTPRIRDKVVALADDPSPRRAAAGGHRRPQDRGRRSDRRCCSRCWPHCGDDKLIPHIVWQNLHPLLEDHADEFLAAAGKTELTQSPNLAQILPRVVERILAAASRSRAGAGRACSALADEGKNADPGAARQCLAMLAGEGPDRRDRRRRSSTTLREQLLPMLRPSCATSRTSPLHLDAALLAATLEGPGRPRGGARAARGDRAARGAAAAGAGSADRGRDDAGVLDSCRQAAGRPQGQLGRRSAARCWPPWAGWTTQAWPTSCWTPTRAWSRPAAAGHRAADAADRLGQAAARGHRREEGAGRAR